VNSRLGVIGVPTSAGAFAPGKEQAPRALRDAGLVDFLTRPGVDVCDRGDCEPWRWRPDRENRRAQNLGKVVEIARHTARRVRGAIAEHEVTLVLGGDCTVGIGTVAGHVATDERVRLIYFDAHADLNVPASVREGALDWMGLAHLLGEPGASSELVGVGERAPLLEAEQILLFGWDLGRPPHSRARRQWNRALRHGRRREPDRRSENSRQRALIAHAFWCRRARRA